MLRVADALRPALRRTCSRSRCGAGRRSTRRCGSSRKTRGSGWPSSARRSRTSSSRCCCGLATRSATRTIPTTSSRRSSRSRPQAGSTCSASSTRSTGCRTCSSRSRPSARPATLCEAAICYTGDILDPKRTKYNLTYYVDLAKELEKRGHAHARHQGHGRPVQAVRGRAAGQGAARGGRRADPLPHARHRRRPGRAASCMAAEAGVDIVDGAMALDVGPDQPAEPERARRGAAVHRRATRASTSTPCIEISRLLGRGPRALRAVRDGPCAPPRPRSTATRCPAGSTRTCTSRPRRSAWPTAGTRSAETYAEVNQLFGDIVKVTPTSKVVGDMALFMVANNLTPGDVARPAARAGVPRDRSSSSSRAGSASRRAASRRSCRSASSRAASRSTDRPGANLPPADFDAAAREGCETLLGRPADRPRRRSATCSTRGSSPTSPRTSATYSDTSASCRRRSSSTAWSRATRSRVEIEPGKTLIVKFLTVGEPHADGKRTVFFELNGQPREVEVRRPLAGVGGPRGRPKADPDDPQPGRPPRCPAWSSASPSSPATRSRKGQKLLSIEAMKMETTLYAERAGRVAEVLVAAGTQVETGELMMVIGDPGEAAGGRRRGARRRGRRAARRGRRRAARREGGLTGPAGTIAP